MRLAKWPVLWAALIALSAAPALAQDEGGASENGDIIIVDCSQVINVIQGQYGNVTDVGRKAVVAVANDQDLTVNQVNACLGNMGGGEETTDEETTDEETTDEETTDEETTEETTAGKTDDTDDEGDVIAGSIPEADELPDTGGPSGIALAAGCALLGVGLIVNRIFR
jgi:hypothetical protein